MIRDIEQNLWERIGVVGLIEEDQSERFKRKGLERLDKCDQVQSERINRKELERYNEYEMIRDRINKKRVREVGLIGKDWKGRIIRKGSEKFV